MEEMLMVKELEYLKNINSMKKQINMSLLI